MFLRPGASVQFILLLVIVFCATLIFAKDYHLCSDVVTNQFGEIDVEATLFNCTTNIRGGMLPPSYFGAISPREYNPTIVNISIGINTLINVNDVDAQVTFDLYYEMYWKDPRLALPDELWDDINPAVGVFEGIEITPYVRGQNQLQIWLPDIQIMEGVEFSVQAELIHLFKNRSIFWSRHVVVTLTQAQMDLHQYPNDNQYVQMSFQSYAYSDEFIILAPIEGKGFVTLNTVPGKPDVPAISLNRLWTYNEDEFYVQENRKSSFFHKTRKYSIVTLKLVFTRQNFGIILRMVLPVVIFMMVVAWSFWADMDKRVDITVQMLLVVSSLYFVIGQIIPFVGYFTVFDLFITIFFAILGVTIALHFVIYQLELSGQKYPLMSIAADFLLFCARVGSFPLFLIVTYLYFPNPEIYFEAPMMVIFIVMILIGLNGSKKFVKSCYFTLCKLRYLQETRAFKSLMHSKGSDMDKQKDLDNAKVIELAREKLANDPRASYLIPALLLNVKERKEMKQQDKEHEKPITLITAQKTFSQSNSNDAETDNHLFPQMTPPVKNKQESLNDNEDALSDIETIDTAEEHHFAKHHIVGKMKRDDDIAHDLLINHEAKKKHNLEYVFVRLLQGIDCCEYHRHLRGLMVEEEIGADDDVSLKELRKSSFCGGCISKSSDSKLSKKTNTDKVVHESDEESQMRNINSVERITSPSKSTPMDSSLIFGSSAVSSSPVGKLDNSKVEAIQTDDEQNDLPQSNTHESYNL